MTGRIFALLFRMDFSTRRRTIASSMFGIKNTKGVMLMRESYRKSILVFVKCSSVYLKTHA